MNDSTYIDLKPRPRERVDIRVGVERRRRWPREEKLRIVRESLEPNAVISEVARRNEISASLIYVWRRQALAGLLEGFHAVRVVAEPRSIDVAEPCAADLVTSDASLTAIATEEVRGPVCPTAAAKPDMAGSSRPHGLIEVTLPSGVEVRVAADVEPRALRCVLAALGAELNGTSAPGATASARGRRR